MLCALTSICEKKEICADFCGDLWQRRGVRRIHTSRPRREKVLKYPLDYPRGRDARSKGGKGSQQLLERRHPTPQVGPPPTARAAASMGPPPPPAGARSPRTASTRGRRARLGVCAAAQGSSAPRDSDTRAVFSARPSTTSTRAALWSALRVRALKRTRAERCTVVEGGSLRAGGHVRTVSRLGALRDSTPRHPLASAQPIST